MAGKKKNRFINKNSENTVTFKIVSATHDDPRRSYKLDSSSSSNNKSRISSRNDVDGLISESSTSLSSLSYTGDDQHHIDSSKNRPQQQNRHDLISGVGDGCLNVGGGGDRNNESHGDDNDNDDANSHSVEAGQKYVTTFKLIKRKKRGKSTNAAVAGCLPASFYKIFTAEDFGIHENLPEAEYRELCREVYGTDEIPLSLRADGREGKNRRCSTKNEKMSLTTAAAAAATATATAEKKRKTGLRIDEGDEDKSEGCNIGASAVAAAKGRISEEVLENSVCYFPLDGYDYEQHLSRIDNMKNFIPAISTIDDDAAAAAAVNRRQGGIRMTAAEKEILDALERADEYDDLEDDFVATAAAAGDSANDSNSPNGFSFPSSESSLLWGVNHKSEEVAVEIAQRSAAEKREIQKLLEKTRSLSIGGCCGASVVDDNGDDDDDDALLVQLLEKEYNEDDIGELHNQQLNENQQSFSAEELLLCSNKINRRNFVCKRNRNCGGYADDIHDVDDDNDDDNFSVINDNDDDDDDNDDNERMMIIEPLTREQIGRIVEFVQNMNDDVEYEDATYKYIYSGEVEDESRDDDQQQQQHWDCETILTSYSNVYNRPSRISRPLTLSSSSNRSILPLNSLEAIFKALSVRKVIKASAAFPSSALVPSAPFPSSVSAAAVSYAAAASDCSSRSLQQQQQTLQLPSLLLSDRCPADSESNKPGDDIRNSSRSSRSSEEEGEVSIPEVVTKRPRNESKEEKKSRKSAAREARRWIRQCKKQNLIAEKEAKNKKRKIRNSKNHFDIREGVSAFRL